ncbi:MAG: hypothetical protein LUC34_07005 [Campylobacter sp.]|nr:hypothetical protein [Campylobacter sp.]
MRKGFSLLAAIFFVVVTSSLCMLALSLSNSTMRQTGEIYLREQAELLAQGATEYAMLRILGHDFNTGCLSSVSGRFPANNATAFLQYTVNIQYFGNIGNCVGIPIQTRDSAGTVMLDVFVTSIAGRISNPISFHKRTVQKI